MSTVWIGMIAIAIVLFVSAAAVGYAQGAYRAYRAGAAVLDEAKMAAGRVTQSAREAAMDIVDQLRSQAQLEANRIVDNARGIAEVEDSELLGRIAHNFDVQFGCNVDTNSIDRTGVATFVMNPQAMAKTALEAVRG